MMFQTLSKITTFDEFVDWLPENSGMRYELHNGNVIEMAQPVGEHEEVKLFLQQFSIKRTTIYFLKGLRRKPFKKYIGLVLSAKRCRCT